MTEIRDKRVARGSCVGRMLLVLFAMLAATPASASAASQPQRLLNAIVRADGRSAVASPIIRPDRIATAVVEHARNVTVTHGFVASSHTICDVYRFRKGHWHRVGHIDFGPGSLGTDIFRRPEPVALTGAVDFLIFYESASAPPVSVISDVGGRWHAVPFQQPGQAPQTAVPRGQVHGSEIISEADNCVPSCIQGHITQTIWRYNAGARAFLPYAPPAGPCSQQTLTGGAAQVVGCFTGPSSTGQYSTAKSFTLNGLTFNPLPGTTFTFDPNDPTTAVTASGPGCMQVIVTILGAKLGSLDLRCWNGSSTVSFANDTLVLKSRYASTPAGNFVGLPFVYASITLQSGYTARIQGAIGLAPLYGNPLANASFTGTTDNVHGLTLGQMCARINPGACGGSLMKFGGGGAVFPLRTASLCWNPLTQELIGSATVGLPIENQPGVKPALKATLALHVGTLPAPDSLTVPDTHVKVSFAGLEIGGQSIGVRVYYLIYLQQLSGGVYVYPHLHLHGEVGFSLGPQVNLRNLGQGIALLEGIGSVDVDFGGDDGFADFFFPNNPNNYTADVSTPGNNTWNYDGKLYLLGTNYSAFVTLASAHVTFRDQGASSIRGTIGDGNVHVLPSLNASVHGAFLGKHFTLVGTGNWSQFGQEVAKGAVLVSDRGIAGCAYLSQYGASILGNFNPIFQTLATTTEIGFQATTAGHLSLFLGCSFGDLATVAGVSSAAAGARTITIPRGRRAEVVAVHGATGPPAALITGPGGRQIAGPPRENRLTTNDGALVLADTADNTTYYVIGKPRPGRWTIDDAEGSSPISSVSIAGELGSAAIRARVTGTGQSRRLSWRFNGARGRTVMFIDTGRGAQRLITTTTHSRGSVRFNPLAAGSPGDRRILAIVEQDGAQRSQSYVARYLATPPPPLGAIRGLRVIRRGRRVTILWHGVAGARVYLLTIRFGRRQSAEFILPARTTHQTITTALGGRVAIFASGTGRAPGPTARARFKAQRR